MSLSQSSWIVGRGSWVATHHSSPITHHSSPITHHSLLAGERSANGPRDVNSNEFALVSRGPVRIADDARFRGARIARASEHRVIHPRAAKQRFRLRQA